MGIPYVVTNLLLQMDIHSREHLLYPIREKRSNFSEPEVHHCHQGGHMILEQQARQVLEIQGEDYQEHRVLTGETWN